MEVSLLGVLLAALVQFIFGALWYMPIFGKAWGEIHGFNNLSKKEQEKAQKEMMPLLAFQFVFSGITAFVLARLMIDLPSYSAFILVWLMWIGFVAPTQVNGVIFGGTDPKWLVKKSLIMVVGSLISLMLAVMVIGYIQ